MERVAPVLTADDLSPPSFRPAADWAIGNNHHDSKRVNGFLRLFKGNATAVLNRWDSNAAAIISTVKRAS